MSAKFKSISIAAASVKRQTFTLTASERTALAALPVWASTGYKTWQFWRDVCGSRGIDYQTIIGNPDKPGTFTALPSGHGKHWCWPAPVACKARPEVVMA